MAQVTVKYKCQLGGNEERSLTYPFQNEDTGDT